MKLFFMHYVLLLPCIVLAAAQQIENESEFDYYIAKVQPSGIKSLGKGIFEFSYNLKKFKDPRWYPSWAKDTAENEGGTYIPCKEEVRAYLDSIPNQAKLLVNMAPCKLSIDCSPFDDPAPLASSFAACSNSGFLPSVDQLLWRGKLSDDGLMAAFEYYDEFARKGLAHSAFYDKLCAAALKKIDEPKAIGLGARALVAKLWTARSLGGDSLTPEIRRNQEIYERIREETSFMSKKRSLWKPVGFYTWTKKLSYMYSRDRTLQQPFLHNGIEAMLVLLAILDEDTLIKKTYYDEMNRFALLNGVPKYNVAEAIGRARGRKGFLAVLADSVLLRKLEARLGTDKMTLLPSAYTPEDRFLDSRSDGGNDEEGIMDPFMTAIAQGTMHLKPGSHGSWYEYQQYALEPLLRFNDSAKIYRSDEYADKLKMTFKSLYAAHRETHAMSGYGAGFGGESYQYINQIALMIKPACRIEPMPEVYLRTSAAYDRLASIMKAEYTDVTFKGLRPDNANALTDAFTEVSWLGDLYYGLYLVSCEDVGMRPKKTVRDQNACIKQAEAFLSRISNDAELKQDIRFMLPITSITDNPENDASWFWVVDGIDTLKTLSMEFMEDPGIEFGTVKPEQFTVVRTGFYKKIATADFFEISLPANRTLDRNAFRKLADKAGRVQDKIREALEKKE
jgi:hypothetical protein